MSARERYRQRTADGVRRYCWRTGVAAVVGWPCVECGTKHPPMEDQTLCAAFVAHESHGHPCELRIGHDGACRFSDHDDEETT